MADTNTYLEKGVVFAKNTIQSFRAKANAAISPNLLLAIDSSGNVGAAGAGSARVVGASGDDSVAIYDPVDVLFGAPVRLTSDTGSIVAGYPIKAAASGKATVLIDTALAGTTLDTSSVGVGAANQTSNEACTLVSDDNADTMAVTLYGITNGTNTVVVETIALTGTTPVDTVKTDWTVMLAASIASAPAGTVTIKEKSGGATITTLTSAALTRGLDAVTGGSVSTYNVIPVVKADGATTKKIGLVGTNSAGTTIYDSKALNGATDVTMNSAFRTVTYFLTLDLENTRTAILMLGAEEDDELRVGRALENQTVAGDTFFAYVTP